MPTEIEIKRNTRVHAVWTTYFPGVPFRSAKAHNPVHKIFSIIRMPSCSEAASSEVKSSSAVFLRNTTPVWRRAEVSALDAFMSGRFRHVKFSQLKVFCFGQCMATYYFMNLRTEHGGLS